MYRDTYQCMNACPASPSTPHELMHIGTSGLFFNEPSESPKESTRVSTRCYSTSEGKQGRWTVMSLLTSNTLHTH